MDFLRSILTLILTLEARAALYRYKPRIIAIVGSDGKTTTKDAIFAAISPHVHVRKGESAGSGEEVVALTILGCDESENPLRALWNIVRGLAVIIIWRRYPEWLIIEIGADRPGVISRLARWFSPDIVVCTGVAEVPTHVEYFDSREALFEEKHLLLDHVKESGTLVLNGDDVRMRELHATTHETSVTYGVESWNDFRASDIEIAYDEGKPTGLRFRVNRKGSSLPVAITGALGNPRVYAALAALAVAEILGVDLVFAARALGEWAPPPGRLRILEGARGSTIIDDTYNASPAAAHAALDALKLVATTGRRIALIGDMLELGKFSAEAHRALGARAAQAADLLITVGFRARATAEAALDAGMLPERVRQYELNESARAGKELELELQEGDLVLIKGSEVTRMERAVEVLMNDPARARELLVRQAPLFSRI